MHKTSNAGNDAYRGLDALLERERATFDTERATFERFAAEQARRRRARVIAALAALAVWATFVSAAAFSTLAAHSDSSMRFPWFALGLVQGPILFAGARRWSAKPRSVPPVPKTLDARSELRALEASRTALKKAVCEIAKADVEMRVPIFVATLCCLTLCSSLYAVPTLRWAFLAAMANVFGSPEVDPLPKYLIFETGTPVWLLTAFCFSWFTTQAQKRDEISLAACSALIVPVCIAAGYGLVSVSMMCCAGAGFLSLPVVYAGAVRAFRKEQSICRSLVLDHERSDSKGTAQTQAAGRPVPCTRT
jgi:hypothetical protein